MCTMTPREVVRGRDVGRRRQQCVGLTFDRLKGGHHNVRNAVPEASTTLREHKGELKTVGRSLPVVADRHEPLAVPGGINFGVVDESRTDGPGVVQLIAGAWSRTVLSTAGYLRSAGEAARQQDVELVVNVPKIHILSIGYPK